MRFPACAERIPVGMLLLMRNQFAITGMGGRVALFSAALALSPFGSLGFLSLQAQNAPTAPAPASPSSTPSPLPPPPSSATNSRTTDTANPADKGAGAPTTQAPAVQSPSAITPRNPTSKAAAEMTAAMEELKSEGKLTSNRAVSAAVRKVVIDNSIQHEIPAPLGAKVVAVHKYPGDLVRVGDKIVTLEFNGKRIPIFAKQDGIMQTINVSKGGVIGNSRPRAAKHTPQQGSILLTLRNI